MISVGRTLSSSKMLCFSSSLNQHLAEHLALLCTITARMATTHTVTIRTIRTILAAPTDTALRTTRMVTPSTQVVAAWGDTSQTTV